MGAPLFLAESLVNITQTRSQLLKYRQRRCGVGEAAESLCGRASEQQPVAGVR